MPLALAVVLGFLCLRQFQHRQVAMKARDEQRSNVASLENMIRQLDVTPLINKDIAAPATPDEQAAFLTQLRVNAADSGVKMVQYNNMGPVAPPPGDPNAQQPSDFTPVASTLAVQGNYTGIRAFAYSLLRAKRLMNMNGVTWKRDPDRNTTTLSFTLIRYVTPPEVNVTTTMATNTGAVPGGDVR